MASSQSNSKEKRLFPKELVESLVASYAEEHSSRFLSNHHFGMQK